MYELYLCLTLSIDYVFIISYIKGINNTCFYTQQNSYRFMIGSKKCFLGNEAWPRSVSLLIGVPVHARARTDFINLGGRFHSYNGVTENGYLPCY